MIYMARSMTNFVRHRLRSLCSWRATTNVSTRQATICERCTTKQDSRCSTYRFLTLACQLKTTSNRQSTTPSHTPRQDTTLWCIVQRGLDAQDCLLPQWTTRSWGSLVRRRSSGFAATFPMRLKHRSNNGCCSTTEAECRRVVKSRMPRAGESVRRVTEWLAPSVPGAGGDCTRLLSSSSTHICSAVKHAHRLQSWHPQW